jgi:hypothetical protein
MIINIRGTSGSGKTHTVRKFMEYCGLETRLYMEDKVIAHMVHFDLMPVYFIGSYVNVCGGCDSIPTQDMACSLVRHFSQFGHVIFEGLLMSHLYARYAALYLELTEFGNPFIFAYMDTPLDLCIDRVKQRRLEKGNLKEFNPQNTISHYESTWSTETKFQAVGIATCHINHRKNPVTQIIELIDRDRYMSFDYSYREESFR